MMPKRPLTPRQLHRQQRILSAALKVFSEVGYDDVPNRAKIRRNLENGLRVFLGVCSMNPQSDLALLAEITRNKKVGSRAR